MSAQESNGDQEKRDYRSLALILGGWQILALFLTCTSVFSQCLADEGFDGPLLQSLPNYVLLSMFAIPLLRRKEPIHLAWWKYAVLALADVEGNYFVVYAYQYTDMPSAMLLDCFAIPMVLGLSCLVLKTRYVRQHYFGVAICISGLALLVLSDLNAGRYPIGHAPNMPLGDVLVLLGAAFYAVSNVGQEYVVKQFDVIEFLGMVGVFGALITVVQMAVLERHSAVWLRQNGTPKVWLHYVGFVASLFSLYIGVPHLLQRSSATMMNISFLTSDFWGVLAALIVFEAKLTVLYFFAFTAIIVGVAVYHLAGSGAEQAPDAPNEADAEAAQSLSEAFEEDENELGKAAHYLP